MLRAIDLAEEGRGGTSPNPMVGAVLVRDGEVIGEGFHRMAGGPHAEVAAIDAAGGDVAGATMYVTLEPCSHTGRTPPCADTLIERGLGRVVYALEDPNPHVSGDGEARMREAGIRIERGPYAEIVARQNEAYLKWVTRGTPLLTLKMAVTLDGKAATSTGESRWVSSEEARLDVHAMRSVSDALMVGVGTVLADDPLLTPRDVPVARMPLRLVVDSQARTPISSRILDTSDAPTTIAVTGNAPPERVEALAARGAEVLVCGSGDLVDLEGLSRELGHRGITSLMVEGGPELGASLLDGGLVDKLVFYFAAKLVGGVDAPGPLAGQGVEMMKEAMPVRLDAVFRVGPDIKVVAYPGGE
ncbi:MAG: bifunctional diaminohydroxyphosphoribosylaminopyrimidine deaminase/5-amino-6-(5-phosphoribosylamino)uracil reductase RibD [Actinobacteria bacterium]|nr:bifunctional diaminohydroxyphosphoribosylaminopyrimidine deaminase/5-amino-6-(5-phosphoribosylamino)uracil reductase RibD [Actinomycetota bacterium]MBU1943886.1 bifunctional diaminohydroxyphosphoribosylaminopyrimidine deaminase/5-amino-6-(5-phosphoribosylamino)uracil reductase RibD [Actinomycetota bacterium]MBU2688592.1 bifunctional diaminohydroxyphosphoribosylaminopyrimidine deaminase/5-amino-6-(5-phosphoribosylamino)uracil reductase RibD [Actinomycetota bacterium]